MSGAKYEQSRREDEEKRPDDGRAVWERPALRRLAANEALAGVHTPSAPDVGQYQS